MSIKMSKNMDWISRAAFACALSVVSGAAFGQDDYENAVLGRAADSAVATAQPDAPITTPSSAYAPAPENDATIDGKIVVYNAKVEVPKGEGYEAVISANGQGLLDELRLYDDDYDLANELEKLAGNIAKEIASEQAQLNADGTKSEPEKNRRPEEAAEEAILQVAKQFALLSKFGTVDEKDDERPQLTRGMFVKKGQYLGQLQDDELKQQFIVALQELLVARKEAEKTLEVDVAIAAARVAQASFKRADSMNKSMPGSISPEEVDEKYYDWIRAAKSIDKARYDLEVNREKVKVSLAQANAAMVQIRNRKLRSPMDGFIDEIYQNEGQWLREGDQVLRILRLDKVQVAGTIDASKYTPEQIDGKQVLVTINRPGAPKLELPGKVVYVRQVVESGCYYFYADVQNQSVHNAATNRDYWLLNPGALVNITIDVD